MGAQEDLIAQLKAIAAKNKESQGEEEDAMPNKKVTKTVLAKVEEYGDALIIPKGMKTREAIELLEKKAKHEEQETSFKEIFNVFPFDGAHALSVVIKKLSGFALREATWSFFEGKQPPMELSVEVEPGVFVSVPWGRIVAPGLDGYIKTGINYQNNQFVFEFTATVKRKDEARVRGLATAMRQYLAEGGSIYQGRAIKLGFHSPEGERYDLEGSWLHVKPRFLDLSKADPERLIFSPTLDAKIKDYFYTHIVHSEACEALNVPGKRGVLFQGPPGVGKTEVAMVGARMATEKGITVVYCASALDFADCVNFAQMYAPAMVICEDIDRVVGGADKGAQRDASIDRILNIMDGIETKKHKIKFVLTSNNVDAIQQPMLRPGRVDASIKFTAPNAQAVDGLIRLYAGSRLATNESVEDAAVLLNGQIPAVIGEVVERAKLSAIRRANGNINEIELKGGDILLAAESIQEQLELLNRKVYEPDGATITAAKIRAASTDRLAEAIKFVHNNKTNLDNATIQAATLDTAGH